MALGSQPTSDRSTTSYLVIDGTLDECLRALMAKPAPQRHLCEIHTSPQPPLVSSIMSGEHLLELVRLRDYL
jgi:hypothetical protein